MTKKILVVSPHPDDETLGAGGFLLKSKAEGDQIYWLIITNMKPEYGYSLDQSNERQEEIQQVADLYNFDGVYNLNLCPAGLERYNKGDLILQAKEIIEEIQPEVILLPYYNDVHSDHKVAFEMMYAALKPFRAPYVKKVYCMEILSETDQGYPENAFTPNTWVDIEAYIDEKIRIMKCYKSEMKAPPFPRNENAIRGMASYRGASCHKKFAEAFYMIRDIL